MAVSQVSGGYIICFILESGSNSINLLNLIRMATLGKVVLHKIGLFKLNPYKLVALTPR